MRAPRTTRSSVTFKAPFRLAALDDALPAGTYEIETEEEAIEGNERTVYVRVATRLILRTTGMTQMVPIDPEALQAAITADGGH